MAEYIERKKAYSIAKKVVDAIANGKHHVGVFAYDIMDWIDDLPAADVREVVLCRDCKNRFMTPNGWRCHYAEWAIEDDDFCSCGEKREG